jgi:hypothetical protein
MREMEASRLGIGYRLAEYCAKPGGPLNYGPAYSSMPLLPDESITLEELQRKFADRMKIRGAKALNSAVMKLLLAHAGCRIGTVSILAARPHRIRRSIRLIARQMFVRQFTDSTYSVEWLQPRVDRLADSEFQFSLRLFLEMFEAPEIQSKEFCAWDTGRRNRWSVRSLRRLSSREFAPTELDDFQERIERYLTAKRDLAESGRIPLWDPKDDGAPYP